MALRKILFIPDPRLRQVAEPVRDIDSGIRTLVDDMFETMYDAPGIGLAAPQIGVMKRVIVVDCATRSASEEAGDREEETGPEGTGLDSEEETEAQEAAPPVDPDPIAMINPQIISFSSETSVYEEGCLSIPDYYEDVERPRSCTVRYTDLEGQVVEREIQGLLSTCVQHEVDHLNGKLFIDYLSRLKRERVMKKFQKLARRAAG